VMIERLGGVLLRHWRLERLASMGAPVGEGDAATWKGGLAGATRRIMAEAPRANCGGEQLPRAEEERVDPLSPIADARKEFVFEVTRARLGNAALFIGDAKFGKAPLLFILTAALARCRAD
ncbi:unnamed protein product, partial [Prorocentrum cordatum]